MIEVVLNELGVVCALGRGKAAVRSALASGASPGMRADGSLFADGQVLQVGHVDGALPTLDHAPVKHRSRNNQLLLAALDEIRGPVEAAIRAHGPQRVGVVLGTSTSGIAEAEAAYLSRGPDGALPSGFQYAQMEVGSPSAFLCDELGLCGPAFTVSTACSSSAKALASARRLLRAGLCDAVLAGGADSICRFTQAGFLALGAVSRAPCAPFAVDRAGINIGEGAALFLMTRAGAGPRLAGVGESSDAHHISAPEPSGQGAAAAMAAALKDADVSPTAIDYLNAHGTATPQNDAMEAHAIHQILGAGVPVSSTKPLSGHALGAAGALEAAFAWLLLTADSPCALPPQLGVAAIDPALEPIGLIASPAPARAAPRAVMSNSFGFGGSNASLILVAGA